VIALEERVDGELPIDARRDAVHRVERIGLGLQRCEVRRKGTQHRPDVDHGTLSLLHRRRAHEDHPVLLAGREAHQPVSAEIEAGEARLVGDAEKLALRVVGPGVIGADEGAGVAAALGDRRTTMAADVGEGAHLPIRSPHQQHRHAGRVLGDVVAGLRKPGRQAHEQRLAAEQRVALAGGALAAGIGVDAVAEERVGEIGGAAVDMAEQPPPDGQLFIPVHGRSVSPSRGSRNSNRRSSRTPRPTCARSRARPGW
jgi:hypothetical protein